MEDLNLLSKELLEQIFIRLNNINWEEDQIDEILDQIWGIEEELELEDRLILLPNFPYINEYLDDYKYLIIHESPKYILLQDIPNQLYDYLEQESQQLIKNLILSNQINNVTPIQIKIQF